MLKDFMEKIADLLPKKEVIRMQYYPGHRVHHRSSMNGKNGAIYTKKVRLAHCLRVAYLSYAMAGTLGLDKKMSARAGLLHDCGFNQRSPESRIADIFEHPKRGALISNRLGEPYEVSEAIRSHMFPLNPRFPPRSGTALVLWLADKFDAILEIISFSTVLDEKLNQYRIITTLRELRSERIPRNKAPHKNYSNN
jgi:putative nucleotidyltransferase with HDIG domain